MQQGVEAMSVSDNISVNNFMTKGLGNIENMGSKLDAKMKEVTASGNELKQEDMIMLQYQMGQYQAYMTMMNNMVSSIQGHMKEMANSIR
jgi:hypothetical protein